jgi:hypothetical protein
VTGGESSALSQRAPLLLPGKNGRSCSISGENCKKPLTVHTRLDDEYQMKYG